MGGAVHCRVFMGYSWGIHGIFICIGYVSVMYRLCIGYASVMYRLCIGTYCAQGGVFKFRAMFFGFLFTFCARNGDLFSPFWFRGRGIDTIVKGRGVLGGGAPRV